MTLEQIKIKNFQSIVDATLELGKFTVIIGPSSSGKSALIRALKTVATNPRGSSFVTQGQSACAITVNTTNGVVNWARKGGSASYEVDGQSFTKLSGDVPPLVAEKLGISDPDVSFSGQFDSPYLLKASAGEVAKTLGALTNVALILEAASSASRRSRAVSGELKVRRGDLARLQEELQEFVGFKERLAAQDEAEKLLEDVAETAASLVRVQELQRLLLQADEALEATSAELVELPTTDRLRSLVGTYETLTGLQDGLDAAMDSSVRADRQRAELDLKIAKVNQMRTDLLHELGTCPVCGSNTKESA